MLTERLSQYFASGVRRNGEALFNGGNVKITCDNADEPVEAVVRGGGRAFYVLIDTEYSDSSLRVSGSCTCPQAEEYGSFCPHIWATLLKIDSEYDVPPPPEEVWMDWLDDDEHEFEEDDDDAPYDTGSLLTMLNHAFSGASGKPGRSTAPRGASSGARKDKSAPPAWAKALERLAASSSGYARSSSHPLDTSPIEPIYVLEAPGFYDHGAFTLSLAYQTVTASGKLGKVKRLALRPADIPRLATDLDRHICLMLIGVGEPEHGYRYYSVYDSGDTPAYWKWRIQERLQGALLPMLFQTQRFRYREDDYVDPVPLAWDDGPPWELSLALTRARKGDRYSLTSQLRRNGDTLKLEDVDCFLRGDPSLIVRDGALARAEMHGCFDWIDTLQKQGSLTIQAAERAELVKALSKLDACPPVAWPAEWNIAEINDLAPVPELSLSLPAPAPHAKRRYAQATVLFRYDDVRVKPTRRGRIILDARGQRQIRRQWDTERSLLGRLASIGLQRDPDSDGFRLLDRRVPEVACALLQEGWTVLGNRKLFHRAGDMSIDVTTGIDWFEMDGKIDFEGQSVTLPELLAAVRRGERFVRLGDGSMGMLPEKWLAQHASLLDLGQVTDGHVRFTRTQVGLVDALLAEMPEATFDEQLAGARNKLREFSGIAPRPAPDGFVGSLRPYQEQGLAWLGFLNDFGWGGCLADDMGLGKTIEVLALLLDRKRKGDSGPSLIVMPKSIVFNWRHEALAFAPELRILDYTGIDRKESREALSNSDVVLTTYGTCAQDIEFLRKQSFNYVILDEAQAIKNPNSLRAKATRLLRSRHKLVMTGTPVENHLGDLWSLFEFLNPGMLGKAQAFKAAFDVRGNNGNGNGDGDGGASAPQRLEMLQRMLRPFILRRTKQQVAPELPERSEQTIECEMSPKQAAYYAELRDYYRASLLGRVEQEGLARSKVYVLEALLRLRQAACHPGLIDESKHNADSAKFETLLPMLEELLQEGHKALVFSQFTSLLALLRKKLDGQTTDRKTPVERFQNDAKCPLFLISLKAGGVGLNLTAADYVFILDPWWNPAVEAQAIDRTHRIGQDKKVIAYRLIARDTVESKILELQARKRDLADAIITEANSLIQQLTREDLEVLLS